MINPSLQYPIFGSEIQCPHCRQMIPALTLTDTYRQHTHPDGIRFEIHEALDRLYTQGYRATRVIIASRYKELISSYLERSTPWRGQQDSPKPRLYGLPVEFSPEPAEEPCWDVINFELEKEPGVPIRYPYFRLFE